MDVLAGPRYIEYLLLDEVVPADENPKEHALEDLGESLGRFGYVEAVAMDERTGKLVAGHGRLTMLKAMQDTEAEPPDGILVDPDGRWRLPVGRGWSSRNDTEAKAYLIASNHIPEKGGWDDGALARSLAELMDSDRDALLGLGFDEAELETLMAGIGEAPTFAPTGEGSQPRLDRKNPVTCPECGHNFEPE